MTPARLLSLTLALAYASSCLTLKDPLTPEQSAMEALRAGRTAEAVAAFSALHRDHPSDLAIGRSLAEAHVKNQSEERLLAQVMNGNTAMDRYLEGLVRFSRVSDAGELAIEAFRKAAALAPAEPEFQHRLGVALLESERFEEALGPLAKAVEMDPTKSVWRLPLAKALSRTGTPVESIHQVGLAIESGSLSENDVRLAAALVDSMTDPFSRLPQSARPKVEKAIQWLELADVPQEAIVALEEVLADFPNEAAPHALLGIAYARLEDGGRAVEELKRAIELAPADGKNHQYLGDIYLGRQREKQAEEQYLKAVELNPVLYGAWLHLGDFAVARSDLIQARKCFGTAVQLKPSDAGARGKLALVYQLEKNWSAAALQLRAVVDRDEENLEFMLRLGLLHTEAFVNAKEKPSREAASQEAQKWLSKVLALQPENALASRAFERVRLRR
jgi:Flp pilus assembly protein TadD